MMPISLYNLRVFDRQRCERLVMENIFSIPRRQWLSVSPLMTTTTAEAKFPDAAGETSKSCHRGIEQVIAHSIDKDLKINAGIATLLKKKFGGEEVKVKRVLTPNKDKGHTTGTGNTAYC